MGMQGQTTENTLQKLLIVTLEILGHQFLRITKQNSQVMIMLFIRPLNKPCLVIRSTLGFMSTMTLIKSYPELHVSTSTIPPANQSLLSTYLKKLTSNSREVMVDLVTQQTERNVSFLSPSMEDPTPPALQLHTQATGTDLSGVQPPPTEMELGTTLRLQVTKTPGDIATRTL